MIEAIKMLRIRGAPAIGICAGYCMYALARDIDAKDNETFYRKLQIDGELLGAARPTAVNLSWVLTRMERTAQAAASLPRPALLARLKAAGVRMAVFSNKADEFARAVVARYFDADLFEVVRGALPDVPTKPAPEGTRALMAHLGVEADGSVLYVGDSNVDVETAHNAGLPCCGVLWGFRTREELTEAGAEYLAEDTQGLEKVVLG